MTYQLHEQVHGIGGAVNGGGEGDTEDPVAAGGAGSIVVKTLGRQEVREHRMRWTCDTTRGASSANRTFEGSRGTDDIVAGPEMQDCEMPAQW